MTLRATWPGQVIFFATADMGAKTDAVEADQDLIHIRIPIASQPCQVLRECSHLRQVKAQIWGLCKAASFRSATDMSGMQAMMRLCLCLG